MGDLICVNQMSDAISITEQRSSCPKLTVAICIPSHPFLWNLSAGPDVGVGVDAAEGAAAAPAEEDDEGGGT